MKDKILILASIIALSFGTFIVTRYVCLIMDGDIFVTVNGGVLYQTQHNKRCLNNLVYERKDGFTIPVFNNVGTQVSCRDLSDFNLCSSSWSAYLFEFNSAQICRNQAILAAKTIFLINVKEN